MKFAIIGIIVGIAAIGGFLIFSGDKTENSQENNELAKNIGGSGQTLVNKIEDSDDKDKVPDFRLKDYEGNEVALADFTGKNIIVNSWAVWCPFCVKELKDFAELKRELGDKIDIIAIDRAESLSKVKGYTDDLGVTDDMIFLLDSSDSFYRSIGGFTMPETLFVDGGGNILLHKRGPMTLDEMRQKTNELFKL